MKRHFYDEDECRRALKQLKRLLEKLEVSVILVEGKNDKAAMERLGFENIMTISGTLKERAAALCGCRKDVVVLTDINERGEELAEEAKSELERYGIRCDVESRRAFARILGITEFENAHKGYDEFMNAIKKVV